MGIGVYDIIALTIAGDGRMAMHTMCGNAHGILLSYVGTRRQLQNASFLKQELINIDK